MLIVLHKIIDVHSVYTEKVALREFFKCHILYNKQNRNKITATQGLF